MKVSSRLQTHPPRIHYERVSGNEPDTPWGESPAFQATVPYARYVAFYLPFDPALLAACYPDVVAVTHGIAVRPATLDAINLVEDFYRLCDEIADQLRLPHFAPNGAHEPLLRLVYARRRNQHQPASAHGKAQLR